MSEKIKTLPVDLYGCETWSLILKKGYRDDSAREWGVEEDICV